MRVHLTGGTGFLGRRVLVALKEAGHEVLATARSLARVPEDLEGLATWTRFDLASDDPAPDLGPLDALIHCAALTDDHHDEALLQRVNAEGTHRVVEHALAHDARKIILVSTLSAAGPRDADEGELEEGNYEDQPNSAYGRSKWAGERAALDLTHARKKKPVILRPGNLFGEGEAPFLQHMLDLLAAHGPGFVQSEWWNYRFQPVHVRDVVLACVRSLDDAVEGTFHLTDRRRPSVGQLWLDLALVADRLGYDLPDIDAPPPTDPTSGPLHFRYVGERAFRTFRHVPTPFQDGLAEVLPCLNLKQAATDRLPLHERWQTVLLNTPAEGIRLNRDMAGGLGFVHENEDRFPPLELLSLAATLEAKGWPTTVVDGNTSSFDAGQLLHYLNTRRVWCLVLEVNLPTLESDIRFLRALTENSRLLVVARTRLTERSLIERILREGWVSCVLLGECDLTIDAVLLGRDPRGTARLDSLGRMIITPEEKLSDLDQLPLPARHRLDHAPYRYAHLGAGDFTTVQTSRGCPYSCGYYCPYPLTQGKTWRARTAESVVAELSDCVEKGLTKILFRDATFTLSKERATRICEGILDARLSLDWWCETRINCLDRPLLALMQRAGCRGINVGLETGNDEILKAGAKAGVDVKRIRETLRDCEELGVAIHLLVTVGLPMETRTTLIDTYRLVTELPATGLGVTGITPFPDTPLWHEAKRKGWILSEEWSRYGANDAVMRTDNLSPEDILFAAHMIFEAFTLSRAEPIASPARVRHLERMLEWARGESAQGA